jgi:hypothetical protein
LNNWRVQKLLLRAPKTEGAKTTQGGAR